MADRVKRDKKERVIGVIESQFSLLQAGVLQPDQVNQAIGEGTPYYLYKPEIQKILDEKAKKDPAFDAKAFVGMLKGANAVVEGDPPRMTDGLTRIHSRERALEVANNPKDEAQVKQIVSIMENVVKLRTEIAPLISDNAELSIALKNKGKSQSDSE